MKNVRSPQGGFFDSLCSQAMTLANFRNVPLCESDRHQVVTESSADVPMTASLGDAW